MKEQFYVLRLWQEAELDMVKASLKDINSNQVRYFSSLESLIRYLRKAKISEKAFDG